MALIQLTEDQVKTWAELSEYHEERSQFFANAGLFERASQHARYRQFISHVAEHSIAASKQHTVFCPLCHGQGAL